MTPAELRAQRDDDEVRLVHADELGRTDPDAAELIALQCAITRGGLPRAEAIAARRREAELLTAHGARLSRVAEFVRSWTFRRGFVEHVTIDAMRFAERGDELVTLAPMLDRVTIELDVDLPWSADRDGRRATEDALALLDLVLATIRRLAIRALDLRGPGRVWTADGNMIDVGEPVVGRLVASGALRDLRGLVLDGVTDSTLRTLIEAPDAAGLDDLELELDLEGHRNQLSFAGATPQPRRLVIRLPRAHEAWADRPHPFTSRVQDLGEVPSAQLPQTLRQQLRRLAVRADLASDPLAALVDAGYSHLEELEVIAIGRGHPGALRPLLRAKHLALRVLRLAMPLDDRLVRALLASPLGQTLEVLDLSRASGDLGVPTDGVVVR